MMQGCAENNIQITSGEQKEQYYHDANQHGESREDERSLSTISQEEQIQLKEDSSISNKTCQPALQALLPNSLEFLANIGIVATSLLLAQLLLRENGLASEQLRPLINLSWLWIYALLGGYISKLVHLPPLLGMLASGICISNLGNVNVPEGWRSVCTSSGLAIILLRSGLELDLDSVKRSSMMTMRLTCIPGCIEAAVSGVSANLLFGMPIWLGLSLGFILAAVSPAVVVSGMLNLQNQGYGVDKGIPSLIIAAASFDDIFAIGGFSICVALAIKGEDTSMLHSAIHGPVSIAMGIFLGMLMGFILSLTKLWDTTWKRSVMIMVITLTLMFGMKAISYPGSGAMGAITLGVVSSFYWKNEEDVTPQFVRSVENNISTVWEIIFEPLLFGSIGSSLNFSLIDTETVMKSMAIVTLGSSLRLSSAFFATAGNNLSVKERCFISLAWLPKATVQAALCSFPLQLVKGTISVSDESYNDFLMWGEQILSTAILSICMTAPLGVIAIKVFGKKWLHLDSEKQTSIQLDNDV